MSEYPNEKTALEWLARDYPDSPKKRLKEWFANGRVTLAGEMIRKPHARMQDPGDQLKMGQASPVARAISRKMPMRLHAQVNLLYIDHSLAIVNKGAGLLSVPIKGESQNSALSVLETYLKGQSVDAAGRARSKQAVPLPLPVHRLDQYTSGLLCFAMNLTAREHLIKQVREHSFMREYLALGDGTLEQEKGTWRSWFELDEEGMEQTVYDEPTDGATEAISHYEVLDTIRWGMGADQRKTISRIRLRLETGLKHQLRIHAARAGVPLLGDRHYHPDFKRATSSGTGMPYGCLRQALHASSIGFIHPETGKTKRFSSKFPRDLVELEDQLRAKKS